MNTLSHVSFPLTGPNGDPGEVRKAWMSSFELISLSLRSFNEAQKLATILFPEDGFEIFKQFRGPAMNPLPYCEVAKRVFKIWLLEENENHSFEDKTGHFLQSLKDVFASDKEAVIKLQSTWEG